MSDGLSALRTLFLDGNRHLRQVLTPIIAGAGIHQVSYAADCKSAASALVQANPHLVFLDFDPSPEEAITFIRIVRRPDERWNLQIPIVVLASRPGREDICAARDSGVSEFLIKPVTTASVMDRLSRVILKPRPFIMGPTYYGPDRRRRADPTYRGPARRRAEGTTDIVH